MQWTRIDLPTLEIIERDDWPMQKKPKSNKTMEPNTITTSNSRAISGSLYRTKHESDLKAQHKLLLTY